MGTKEVTQKLLKVSDFIAENYLLKLKFHKPFALTLIKTLIKILPTEVCKCHFPVCP